MRTGGGAVVDVVVVDVVDVEVVVDVVVVVVRGVDVLVDVDVGAAVDVVVDVASGADVVVGIVVATVEVVAIGTVEVEAVEVVVGEVVVATGEVVAGEVVAGEVVATGDVDVVDPTVEGTAVVVAGTVVVVGTAVVAGTVVVELESGGGGATPTPPTGNDGDTNPRAFESASGVAGRIVELTTGFDSDAFRSPVNKPGNWKTRGSGRASPFRTTDDATGEVIETASTTGVILVGAATTRRLRLASACFFTSARFFASSWAFVSRCAFTTLAGRVFALLAVEAVRAPPTRSRVERPTETTGIRFLLGILTHRRRRPKS